jgi:guanine deaminase
VTLGAAAALGLEHEIGSLEPGRMADLALWDWSVGTLDGDRMDLARNLHEKAFAWLTLADERHLVGTWVAGRRMYARMPA